jgi:hypothetical protein
MKKVILTSVAVVISIVTAIFIYSNISVNNQISNLPKINIDAKYGYSYMNITDPDLDIINYIDNTSLPYEKTLWSGFSFEFNIDFNSKIFLLKYVSNRLENALDVFTIEKLNMFDVKKIDDNSITFKISSIKFGVISCIYFINPYNKHRMIININSLNESILLRDGNQAISENELSNSPSK